MFAQQRKAALVVVKLGRLLPTALAVTTLAILTQGSLVLVVLGVA